LPSKSERLGKISREVLERHCYNPKLGSGCNLDKNLSKSRRDNQLVNYKDTKLYLQLYIPIDYKKNLKEIIRKV